MYCVTNPCNASVHTMRCMRLQPRAICVVSNMDVMGVMDMAVVRQAAVCGGW